MTQNAEQRRTNSVRLMIVGLVAVIVVLDLTLIALALGRSVATADEDERVDALAVIDRPNRADVAIYTLTMLLLILVGVVGLVLHVQTDLTSRGVFVTERFIRGAPFLAPMLFANMGTLGLIALLDPEEPTI